MFNKSKKKTKERGVHLITDEKNFSIIEAYKAIRANINFAVTSPGCKKIMVCSSYSGEGKTTTCVNLAVTIAQTGASVLLIDADMRKPRIHNFLNINNETGLSGYLSNMTSLNSVIKDTDIHNLKVITSGIIPPNPAELLASPKMEKLFGEVEGVTDYIIIDTPPVCIVSDVLPLSKICDGVILIVSHMETLHPQIKEALEKLHFAGANVIGMILNKVKINHASKYYSKYGKYKYYQEYKENTDTPDD